MSEMKIHTAVLTVVAFVIVIYGVAFGYYKIGYNNGYDKMLNEALYKVQKITLGDKNTKVIIDDQTGCRYIVFNNKTLTPLYDKEGKVEGCGEDKND